jgi:hypothetical protein
MPGVRFAGLDGVGKDVVTADRVVAAVQDVALPLAREDALRGAALIARVLVDGASADRRSATSRP